MADAAKRGERRLREPRHGRWIVGSALWGFAEATIFFIVPDVVISAATVRCGLRAGLLAALATAIAAAAGGLLVYIVTANGILDTFLLFHRLPAISDGMILSARAALKIESWPVAMLAGSFLGMPYKIFAAAAAKAGTPLGPFLLWSIPIRLVRFVLVVGAAALLRPLFLRWLGPSLALLPIAAIWIAFYAVFWMRMPS